MKYDGTLPNYNISQWMTDKHHVWFWDPLKLIHNMLTNPDYKDEFDYTPFQERDKDGNHCF